MPETSEPGFFGSLRFRYGLGLLVFLAIAGFFLWEEHEAHILGYLPLILLLGMCLGMHFFMHGGHGGHGSDKGPHKGGSKEDGA
jgi:drug/metabolite transporter (DMT)-like permease